MDYPCAKFGDFGLSRFGFIVRTDRQTDRITDSHDRYTYWRDYRQRQYDRSLFLQNRKLAQPSTVPLVGVHVCYNNQRAI